MARPQKDGLKYFSLDTDFFFGDRRIKILRSKYGSDGVLFYIYLLTEIYRNSFYIRWDEDTKDSCICDLGFTEGFIEQVMEYLLGRSLLTKLSILTQSVTIITSPGIQKRWQAAKKELKRDIFVDPEIWLLEKEETAAFIKFTHFTDKSGKNPDKSGKNSDKSGKNSLKENKVKENKVKENKVKENIYYADAPLLNKAFADYVEFRKKIKKPMTDRAIELAMRNLEKLADNDGDRIEILNQSIMNGWIGLFELKRDNRKRDDDNMFYSIGREEGIF